MTKFLTYIFANILFFISQSHAHGEDRPGPHGGFIRMPGAFHVEVVFAGRNQFEVYLLDMNFKNPTTKNSTVTSSFVDSNKRTTSVPCTAAGLKFLCVIPKSVVSPEFDIRRQTNAQISVLAKREANQASPAVYSLPLNPLPAEKKDTTDHSNHHP